MHSSILFPYFFFIFSAKVNSVLKISHFFSSILQGHFISNSSEVLDSLTVLKDTKFLLCLVFVSFATFACFENYRKIKATMGCDTTFHMEMGISQSPEQHRRLQYQRYLSFSITKIHQERGQGDYLLSLLQAPCLAQAFANCGILH